ncbi:MAG: YqfO family protein [Patescibacteria group bacterium]|jgi:hypothetical protein
MNQFVKIYVFVPKNHIEQLRLALGKAGIGKMGNYDYCSFISEGKGYFRPLKGADPAIGEVGKIEEAEEVKLEFICPKSDIEKALEVIKENHPYEEIALDIIALSDLPSINNSKK